MDAITVRPDTPWKEIFSAPAKCSSVKGAGLSTGTGALLLLGLLAFAILELDRKTR